MEQQELANRLLTLASTLVDDVQTESRGRRAYDPDAECEARLKELGALADEFKDTNAKLIAEVRAAEKKMKEAQATLKEAYTGWKRDSGYEKMRREVLRQAEQCMDIGDKLEDISDDLVVAQRESSQAAYKEKFAILVSTLNDAELKKFSQILDRYFNKVTTDLRTGVKVLDGSVKKWRDEAQDLADERGIALKKASDGRSREAGAIWDLISDFVPKLVTKVKSVFTALYNRIFKTGQVLDGLGGSVDTLSAKLQRAM
jgi:hypothetical protein